MPVPDRLQPGHEVRVVAPSCSRAMIGAEVRDIAAERFAAMGMRLTFGQYIDEQDQFGSSSIEQRLADLHAAFADPAVTAVISVIGGYNANQLLPYLDWDLIAANPKIFCGYSDITALSCAIYAKTGLVTYSGPHYSTFGMKRHFDQTLEWFRSVLIDGGPVALGSASTWSDEAWYEDQDNRTLLHNEGPWVLQPGDATGPLIGGNLCTLNLLHGTAYMPDLGGALVFIEDDFESDPHTFDRDLTSLTQQPGFDQVQGLLIGRFQQSVEMTRAKLDAIIASKKELRHLPVVANMDFGHTDPLMTLPVGGQAAIRASTANATNFRLL